MTRVLLVEDDALVQRAIIRIIRGAHPLAVTDVVDEAPAAIAHLDAHAYDYVVSDFDLRIGTGGDVLRHVRAHFRSYVEHDRFILLSGDLRPAITDLDHPLTFEKPIAPRKLRELLTGGGTP